MAAKKQATSDDSVGIVLTLRANRGAVSSLVNSLVDWTDEHTLEQSNIEVEAYSFSPTGSGE